MEKRATIKDIAEKAGVSIGSVHCALIGKPGVSEQTRLRIIKVANECGYRPNSVAASLKRKTVRIAAAFPGPTEDNRFFFTYVWEGVREYIREVSDFNIELIEVPYYKGVNNHADELSELINHREFDGLLTVGYTDMGGKISLQQFKNKNIPVVLIANDLPQSGRLCCVQPNYQIVGRTLAELILRQIPAGSGILLCAGDLLIPAHNQIVQGFDAYLDEHHLDNPVYKVHANKIKQEVYDHIVRELKRENVKACCCVNARSSVLLGEALVETGKAGHIIAVGSDLFDENINFLSSGVFTNLLLKNPYRQAYMAAKFLLEYLIRGTQPSMEVLYVGSEIVFQSSLPMYENDSYRLII
ncbi:LacI family DNA-binding transcriptional regulator [uncultured Sphaerochaeta sp.]|uniref:LacI family DNA-binding transcriptional regulator n=1 Tax=uncultured Sphaerochaeta sp. TaxID=886478 RepID=UPI002A0A7A09|nr:LacI family DNA-binding transcriptional regulator [uncultured Sphaerochaeta sp.]